MMLFAFDLHVACTCILQVGKGPSIYDVCAGGGGGGCGKADEEREVALIL